MYKKITVIVDSDISKLALIKQSLIGSDKKSTDHLDKIGDVLSYIHQKYTKEDIGLNILLNQAKELPEPWTTKQSLRNIERFLVIWSHFYEWKLHRHLNSKFRNEMVPLLFCEGTTRWSFVEALTSFEDSLHSPSSSSSPLALECSSSTEKSEQEELQSFSLKMDSAANPETEHKRLEFWIACVKKFGDQLRSLSLYADKKNNFNSQKNSFFETPHQNRQGGANLKLRCFTCSNHHMTKNGTPSQYLASCLYFKDQNLHKQKELLKNFKMCAICLNPKSKCRKDPSDKSSPCQLQVKFNLKCKCGDTTHHSLMCPHPKSENSYYQSNNDYQQSGSQRGGRGGSQRGRGVCGGRGRGRGGRHQNDRRSQQYQPEQGRQDSSSFNTGECPSPSNNNCNSAKPTQQGQKSQNTQLN